MSGKGIGDLPPPPTRFRPNNMPPPVAPLRFNGTRKAAFETRAASAEEDATRIRLLKRTANCNPALRRAARRLAAKLQDPDGAATLASSVYMRRQRINIAGKLAQLYEAYPDARLFTVIPRGWQFRPDELGDANPAKLMAGFRSDLNRCGAVSATGFVVAFVHGEYDPGQNIYQLHMHGLADGGMLPALNRMRSRPKYKNGQRGSGETLRVTQRVKIGKKAITDVPLAMAYMVQNSWPSRWSGELGSGKVVRQRLKYRIPEPYHTQVLLWLDQWTLNNISMLFHIRVTNTGFEVKSTK